MQLLTVSQINIAIAEADRAGHHLYMEHFGTFYRIFKARYHKGNIQLFTAFRQWETIRQIEDRIFNAA